MPAFFFARAPRPRRFRDCDPHSHKSRNCVWFRRIGRLFERFVKQAVTGLTAGQKARSYSHFNSNELANRSMSNKLEQTDFPYDTLKNESSRQRWELFHRAIAHAKECNAAAMQEAESPGGDAEYSGPLLTIVR